MKNAFRKVINSKTTKQAGAFYALSMLASVFNFLYYPAIARLANPSIFGEVQLLVSMLFQVSIIFLALNVITIIISTRYGATKRASNKVAALASLFNIATIIITVLVTSLLATGGVSLFQFSSGWPFIALAAAIISTVPFTIAIGRLQGKGMFIESGLLNAGGSLLKLILSCTLVLSGIGTTGALLGIAIGQLVAAVAAIALGKVAAHEVFSFAVKSYKLIAEDRKLVFIAGACIIAANILSIADVAYSKLSLNPHEAGLYAGIATLAKIALYVVSPLMWLVIPLSVKLRENQRKITLLTAIVIALCVGLVIFYVLFGNWFVTLVLGRAYEAQQGLLVTATIAMSALAIATFTNTILAASGRYKHLLVQTLLMVIVMVAFLALTSGRRSISSILGSLAAAGTCGVAYYAATLRISR